MTGRKSLLSILESYPSSNAVFGVGDYDLLLETVLRERPRKKKIGLKWTSAIVDPPTPKRFKYILTDILNI
jgi:hypothetical protein